jgi:hypothetical protein
MNLGASEELASESENVMSTGSLAVPPMLLVRPRVLFRLRRRLTLKYPTIHGRLNLIAPPLKEARYQRRKSGCKLKEEKLMMISRDLLQGDTDRRGSRS